MTSPTRLASIMPEQDTTHSLLSQTTFNWSLAITSDVLPASIRPHLDPPSWPLALVQSLVDLSDLTPNQSSRAYSLLNTYFQSRIREASYTGTNTNIYAALDVENVRKACESVRKMVAGRELEKGDGEKRKYSIRDELVGQGEGDENAAKGQKTPELTLNTHVPSISSLIHSPQNPSPLPLPSLPPQAPNSIQTPTLPPPPKNPPQTAIQSRRPTRSCRS